MTQPGFNAHERDIQKILGLRMTLASGSQFHDIGDAVDGRHPLQTEDNFRLLADAKYTEKASYSLKLKFLQQMTDKAAEQGQRFILPVRFWPRGDFRGPYDYVVLGLEDFAELYGKTK